VESKGQGCGGQREFEEETRKEGAAAKAAEALVWAGGERAGGRAGGRAARPGQDPDPPGPARTRPDPPGPARTRPDPPGPARTRPDSPGAWPHARRPSARARIVFVAGRPGRLL
jgi:hypothetical protein